MLFIAFIQGMGVSLGVGCSTLAVCNYIVASRDGMVDESERRLMGIVYRILRIAMGIILVTIIIQGVNGIAAAGANYVHPFVAFSWSVIIVLFVNAVLMTRHLMPKILGPSLQSASWYMLAVMYFLGSAGLVNYSYTHFAVWYVILIAVAMVVINGSIAYFKRSTQ